MITPPSPEYIEEWRQTARRDWRWLRMDLAAGEGVREGISLQQTLEKFLKAFLLGQGWQLERIHSLPRLLTDAGAFDPQLEPFRDLCRRVSTYYMAERYPGSGGTGPSVEEVRRDAREAAALIARLFPDETLEAP
jgi:HEPN domain-containing protein